MKGVPGRCPDLNSLRNSPQSRNLSGKVEQPRCTDHGGEMPVNQFMRRPGSSRARNHGCDQSLSRKTGLVPQPDDDRKTHAGPAHSCTLGTLAPFSNSSGPKQECHSGPERTLAPDRRNLVRRISPVSPTAKSGPYPRGKTSPIAAVDRRPIYLLFLVFRRVQV